MAFDLLYLNGKSLMDLPLMQRREALQQSVTQKQNRFEIVQQVRVSSLKQVTDAVEKAVLDQQEGIILKDINSQYVAGGRNNSWLKIKPDYIEGLVTDLDLLIIGGYYGTGLGKRGGTISHFLMGVRLSPSTPFYPLLSSSSSSSSSSLSSSRSSSFNSGKEGAEFLSFCKVGTGYTFKELSALQKALEPHWKPFDPQKPPSWMHLAHNHHERPDVWIPPHRSCVLQIKGAQLTATDRFRAGHALRFPRVQHIRFDKPWTDSLDTRELSDLVNSLGNHESSTSGILSASLTGNKRSTRSMYIDHETPQPPEEKVQRITKSSQLQLAPQYQPANLIGIKVESQLFEDIDCCVMNGSHSSGMNSSQSSLSTLEDSAKHSSIGTIESKESKESSCLTKQKIEIILFKHGATILQHPPTSHRIVDGKKRRFVAIATKETLKVKNLIKKGSFDVVFPRWIMDSIQARNCLPLSPKYTLFACAETKRLLSFDFDRFGDSFTSPSTFESLSEVDTIPPLSLFFLMILLLSWTLFLCFLMLSTEQVIVMHSGV